MNTRRSALAALAATLLLGPVGTAPSVAATPDARGLDSAPTYTNPVSAGFADTYADPAVIRGKDGWWYAYGTTDPLREGEGTRHLLPMSRSDDLVDWEYVGDAFTETTLPAWADPGPQNRAALWAPDIRYVDGEYRLYYVVTQTTVTAGANDNAIGVATAPTPTGPWTDAGDPVVDPRPGPNGNPDDFLWTFDPHHVMTDDGTQYLFYGSYYGGIWVTELDESGTEAVGTPTMVAIDNKFEGSYAVQHDGWWYLFASTANCCAGPTTGYSVHVGRSQDVTGPYVDRDGVPLAQSRAGGTPTLYQNGNAFIGAGHNAVVTDLAGQDWIVYHALDRADPFLDEPFGINERPMLIDRLDWVDGWPVVDAGAGPSEGPQIGPVTEGRAVTTFEDDDDRAFREHGDWDDQDDPQSGRFLESDDEGDSLLLTRPAAPRDVRVEADLRQDADADDAYGLVAAARWQADGPKSRNNTGTAIQALIDPEAGTLTLRAVSRGTTTAEATAPLPEGHTDTWHHLALEIRDGRATAELTEARLLDPLAQLSLDLPERTRLNGQAGALATGEGVGVDNLSVVAAAERVTEAEPAPTPGTLVPELSDEFDAAAPAAGWEVVRDPDVTVTGGELVWTVETADLVGAGNDAGILLRDAPAGDWTVETKVSIDVGLNDIRNFQQGGLVAYVDDDLFLRLSHVAIWNTRQTEFGKEMSFADRLSYGGTIIGPPGETTTSLRLVHRTDASGEHELQALTRAEGSEWVEGGVWTLPADADIRVGLISHGRNPAQGGEPASSRFDWFRVYAD